MPASLTMNKYYLNVEEQSAYQAVKETLEKLPPASQYNVLRNVAHMMDRELVRPGAVRAAAAVAGSTAQTRSNAVGAKKAVKQTSRAKVKGMPDNFVKTEEAKRLLARQQEAKSLLSDPPTEEQRHALRVASANLRSALYSFRGSHEGNTDL
jgi:hypothetical protein